MIYDMLHGRVAVFEVKYSLQLQDMEKDCDRALSKIKERFYAKEFENDYDEVWCYGISFFRKRCLVKKNNNDVRFAAHVIKMIYASNEPKSVLARDLGDCRDNLRNSRSVFLIVE